MSDKEYASAKVRTQNREQKKQAEKQIRQTLFVREFEFENRQTNNKNAKARA